MFKKIEIWILYFTVIILLLFSLLFGLLVRQELVGSTKLGWVSKSALFLAEIPVNIKRLLTVDVYVEDRFPGLKGFSGDSLDYESYILLSRYDVDLHESLVELIDLRNFEILHTWNPDLNLMNKSINTEFEFKYEERDRNENRARIWSPLLTSDGGLVFHLYSSPLRKIDECSKILFENQVDAFRHSIEINEDQELWVPSYLYPQQTAKEKIGRQPLYESGFHDDAITKLNSDGEVIFQKSVSDIFIKNGLEYLLFATGDQRFTYDPIHLNDIQPVNFDTKYWKKGDLFLSFRHQSMVILYRPSTDNIIWIGTGPFFHQHDVDILDDHRISVFNNNSKDFLDGDVVDGNNQVVIYDFSTEKYSLYLNEGLINNDVRTITEGRSQILPNGDLFIEESNYGRTLFFNNNGDLQWTHVNRGVNGNIGRVSWSRILYSERDLRNVKNFLDSKKNCSND
tara:strand:+ start:2012 stop:3373 length:1362 start_codon:yes stop_codon:yes gene_type:complete